MGIVDYCNKAPSREKLLRGEWPAWVERSPRAKYIAQVIISCPPWVDRAELRALKAEAARRTRGTGVLHVLAHKVPLTHPLICGLTVPWNLEVKPWRANLAESNWFTPDQAEMFDTAPAAAQLRLL